MGEWESQKWLFRCFSLHNGRIDYYEKRELSKDEIKDLIRKYPNIIPLIKSRNCYVLDNEFIGDDDLLIIEKLGNKLYFYIISFNWFNAGSSIREIYDSPRDAYWSLGISIESLDETLFELLKQFRSSRSKKILEVKKNLRKVFNLDKIRIAGGEAIVVVDELTMDFKDIIDAVNEITDILISAMEISAHCINKDKCIYVLRFYCWA